MLIGNKKDKENREVPYNTAAKYAMEHNFGLIEVSAKLGHGVKEAFSRMIAEVYKSMEQDMIEEMDGQEKTPDVKSSLVLSSKKHYKFTTASEGTEPGSVNLEQPNKKKCCKGN